MVKANTPSVTVGKMTGLHWKLKASSKWGYLGLWWADGQGILIRPSRVIKAVQPWQPDPVSALLALPNCMLKVLSMLGLDDGLVNPAGLMHCFVHTAALAGVGLHPS